MDNKRKNPKKSVNNLKKQPRTNTRWNKSEDNILSENFGKISNKELAKLLPNRTEKAIAVRARLIGLIGPRGNYSKWTDEEKEIIRTYYPKEGLKCTERLQNRSWRAVRQQAKELGVNCRKHPWTKEEEDILRKYYPEEGIAVIKRLPNHTKGSTALHVMQMKLRYNKNNKSG